MMSIYHQNLSKHFLASAYIFFSLSPSRQKKKKRKGIEKPCELSFRDCMGGGFDGRDIEHLSVVSKMRVLGCNQFTGRDRQEHSLGFLGVSGLFGWLILFSGKLRAHCITAICRFLF